MGIIDGGTTRDLAQQEVLINFAFEPKGTKKNLDTICKARSINNAEMRKLCEQEADTMVRKRYKLVDKDGQYIFSKDSQGNYFWRNISQAQN